MNLVTRTDQRIQDLIRLAQQLGERCIELHLGREASCSIFNQVVVGENQLWAFRPATQAQLARLGGGSMRDREASEALDCLRQLSIDRMPRLIAEFRIRRSADLGDHAYVVDTFGGCSVPKPITYFGACSSRTFQRRCYALGGVWCGPATLIPLFLQYCLLDKR